MFYNPEGIPWGFKIYNLKLFLPMSIYQTIILDHYKNSKFRGHLKNATHKVSGDNPSCGDVINFELEIVNNKIKNIAFSGHGCIISQASASMICGYLKNKSVDEIKKLDKKIILNLLHIDLGLTRLKCALLPMEVVKKLSL